MVQRTTGRYVSGSMAESRYQAFIPAPLPPDPPLDLTGSELIARKERADQALGRLDGITLMLPDPQLFLYQYVRKEALLSSQIEGTQSSLSDLLLYELYELDEAPGVPLDDVEEVSNYVSALNHGLRRLREDDFPLSLRLIREMHALLLQGGRGGNKHPGEFRTGSVGVTLFDGSRHTPPAMTEAQVAELMHNMATRSSSTTETAIRTMLALMRQQVFWDGNKRTATLFANALMMEKGCGILEIAEAKMPEFNEKLSAFYRSGDDSEVAAFLYQYCISGIDY